MKKIHTPPSKEILNTRAKFYELENKFARGKITLKEFENKLAKFQIKDNSHTKSNKDNHTRAPQKRQVKQLSKNQKLTNLKETTKTKNNIQELER